MKYRDIAKNILLARGAKDPITADEGVAFGEGKPFTPKQLRKTQESLDGTVASLKKKWKIDADD